MSNSDGHFTAEDAARVRLNEYNELYEKLAHQLQSLQAGTPDEELLDHLPAFKASLATNNKLKYRLEVLKKSVDAMPPPAKKTKKAAPKINYVTVEDYGDSIVSRLREIFAKAQATAYPTAPVFPVVVTETSNPKFGDYQCNSALGLSKLLKTVNINEAPPVVAKKIVAAVEKGDLIKELEVAGPGFINVHLQHDFIGAHVGSILTAGVSSPKITKRKAVVDFSAPNIAKEMHVGHLRSTIIGDSICRLLEFVGFDVARINHVGDWGTQFGMLVAHLQDTFPNYLVETPPIADLQSFYKESKQRFDADKTFKARAYECVVKLQNFDEDIVKGWKLICDVSRADFNRIYQRLDVTIIERGESFYQQRMIDVVAELDAAGVLKTEEGRRLMFPTDCTIPLTVVKSDGGFTYDTSDMATIKHRIFEEKADWLLYVVDAGQSLHLETIYAAARDLGYYTPEEKRVQHIGFGLVLGEDKKKFRTRAGDTVRLTELLDEGVKRSEEKLREKGRHEVLNEAELAAAKEAVAYGCIKYADLSHNRINDYVFSFDRMLDDRGNTAVYLLYCYARIRSIARNAGLTRKDLNEKLAAQNGVIQLKHEAEVRLGKQILKFADTLLLVLDTLLLNTLCEYVYTLSTVYTDFYGFCQVITKDKEGKIESIDYNRLALCEATADTMAACFKILGIRTLEKI
uniref:Probable arginine--tRNA ligase, cytoplasmic n=1 Tax=Panagrellus redivivus TaxID=6233 RepID=A0A7E4VDA7_PANRE